MPTALPAGLLPRLNRVLRLARDAHALHTHAVQVAASTDLAWVNLLVEMAQANERVIDRVSRLVIDAGGVPEVHGTLGGRLREYYGALGALLGDAELQYLGHCRAAEGRLLDAMDAALHAPALDTHGRAELMDLQRDTRQRWNTVKRLLLARQDAP
ncbi:DUF2383 domain-containing protein [Stenotrophomonas sp. LGBM10]|uniref:DUF2383 domain-containing protein n=1 Tax=Stenotrophomonas sp. LGBM10 TaxID=3390038 RepID=UPI00398B4702